MISNTKHFFRRIACLFGVHATDIIGVERYLKSKYVFKAAHGSKNSKSRTLWDEYQVENVGYVVKNYAQPRLNRISTHLK